MSWEALAFLLGLVIAAILMFGAVWFVILLTDLEADYINPIELCNSLNQWVLPEAITHSALFAIFILNGLWLPSLINLPLLAWNINK
ncbi:hypothetical protein H4R35_001172 [Dimargaris xerosporica]|nr:hypothetical protein H4R35_001172 [Dimargaris xerosporica]